MRLRSLLAGCAVGAVVASAVGIAYGAIPDGNKVVHACYQNVTSANKPVKLLDTAKTATCPSGWKPVAWNQQGVQGLPGKDGTNGTSIAARARLSSPTAIPPGSTTGQGVALPLSGASWTQAAGQLDQLYADQMSVTGPSSCTNGSGLPSLSILVEVNGQAAFTADVNVPTATVQVNLVPVLPSAASNAYNQAVNDPTMVFERNSPRSDVITARAYNRCLDPGQTITVNSISVDVADLH